MSTRDFIPYRRSLIIFGGGSGSGKTYIADMLTKKFPQMYHKMIQMTTREMREGEKQEDPYLFVNDTVFDRTVDNLIFTTRMAHGRYGTSTKYIDVNQAQIVIADMNAVRELVNKDSSTYKICKNLFDKVLLVGFSYDPNKEENKFRMKGRENRDNSFYNKFLPFADIILYNDAPNYLDEFKVNDAIRGLLNIRHGLTFFDETIEELTDKISTFDTEEK
jgi:guanylate kinase